MPLSSGMTVHDDTKHKGSAKRDTVNGVAALNVDGSILAPGFGLYLTRSGLDNVLIYERTSNEGIFRINRVGVKNYDVKINSAGLYSAIQVANMKDVANGIAGLDASAEITSRLAYENIASGIAGLDADVKVFATQMPLPMLTVAQFQANVATGTADNPARANDTLLADQVSFNVVGEYVEVQFDHYNFITKYRMYGYSGAGLDGKYKIQHYEDGGWVDNTLNIPTNLDVWSSWALLDIPVYTNAIRLVVTFRATGFNENRLGEFEIEG